MTASPVTRLIGLVGLLGLGPIAGALAVGWRSLPEAALAASAWFAGVLALSWLLRWVLESAAVTAERRVDSRDTTPRRAARPAGGEGGGSAASEETSRRE